MICKKHPKSGVVWTNGDGVSCYGCYCEQMDSLDMFLKVDCPNCHTTIKAPFGKEYADRALELAEENKEIKWLTYTI